MKLKFGTVVILALLGAAAASQTTPRHIGDLGRAGFLALPTGEPPEMTTIAGARFLDLVPESQREVCRILLEHQAREVKGLYRLRVVDGRGRDIMRCTL